MRIEWGYFYLVADKNNTSCNIGESAVSRTNFVNNTTGDKKTKGENENSKMSLTHDLGSVKNSSGKVMISYDDMYSIQYFGENLRPYWNSDGSKTIVEQFHIANEKLIVPLHLFMNETVDRVPMSDWVFTDKPNYRGFKASSVVGGYYIKMLEDKLKR